MNRTILALIVLWVLSVPHAVEAQKVWRIGALLAEEQFTPAVEGSKKKTSDPDKTE